ncbi:phage antirepressor N-terminal domain-containing protein [Acinetobacter bereziniae]|uniref:phage antirepressor N-terminal domain-containing protein n=1 Tax=Acinetobacter bereziniae TaxID=106648 RepID=UPI003AF9DDE2
MTSNSLQQITVPFHNAELFLVEHNGQPYTAMRPIVLSMGLDWKAQLVKIKQRFSSVVGEITTTGKDGKQYQMLCLPLKKLFGWLMTISPNKVKPELRDTVIKYQEECDDVLWDYWTKGIAINLRSTKQEREPLTNAVNLLVAKTKHLNYSDAYKLVHQRFNVKHIDEIPCDEILVAVEYVHHLIALYNRANKQGSLFDSDTYELVRQLTESIILENDEIVPILLAVKMIDEKKFAYLAHKVVRANEHAKEISRELDFRTKIGEPLIDVDCRVISLSTGQRFAARPNWFNAPAW